jgi:hypothetical protein
MRSSDPCDATVEMESSDVQSPAGDVAALTHISRVNAAEPNAVAGTRAGDASEALIRRMLPACGVHATDGDGVAVTAADVMRDGDCKGERDGDDVGNSDGDADTAAHAALSHANVCVWAAVSGRLASTCANAPSTSNVCVVARSWQLVGPLPQSPTRLVKTTDCSTEGVASVTCQNSLELVPSDA